LGQSQAQCFTFLDTHVRIALFWHGNTVAPQREGVPEIRTV
jgi:hypothetical protein